MAIGDISIIQIQKALSTTATDTQITNTSSSYQTIVKNLTFTFQDGASTARVINVYKNGTGTSNKILTLDLDPNGNFGAKSIIISDPSFYLTGIESLSVKQSLGADINCYISAISEQIS